MNIQSLFGLFVFVGVAWLISENRRNVSYKFIVAGLLSQLIIALILLKVPLFKNFFMTLNDMVLALETATQAGTSFVFGYLGGGALPFDEKTLGSSFILAFKALPLILVMSAISALLFHWRILPVIVGFFSKALQKIMNVGGASSLGVAANIFVGMVEAPLFVRPYLLKMTRSDLFILMTSGMATVAGTVMALYATILSGVIDDAMGHILTASLISAPAAILVAKLMIPGESHQITNESAINNQWGSAMDAITYGTIEGGKLLAQIIAMLIVLVALVNLVNQILGLLPDLSGEPVTLQKLLGYFMAPVAWLMGIPWKEAVAAGSLLGIKTVLNEFLAYIALAKMTAADLSANSQMIMTYALCGFANFGSLGIMIGGMSAMAPERRSEIVKLGLKSIISGTIATCMTGAIVGMIL